MNATLDNQHQHAQPSRRPQARRLATAALVVGALTSWSAAPANAIIGGTKDTGDPAVVAIVRHAADVTSDAASCSGTIIAPTKVLTAAHCVDPAIVGENQVFEVVTGSSVTAGTRLAVSSAVMNPAFHHTNATGGHDEAVLTLAVPTTIKPIPYRMNAYTSQLAAKSARLVGFGANNHTGGGIGTKRTVTAPVQAWNSLYLHIGSTSKQSCHVDSGGPSLQMAGGVETIVAVISYGMDLGSDFQCYGGGYSARTDVDSAFIQSA